MLETKLYKENRRHLYVFLGSGGAASPLVTNLGLVRM
jgi:hypothetical protein